MYHLIRLISLRRMVHHKLRSVITLFGITLGVAMLVAVNSLNRTIIDSFSRSLESVSGRATLQVSAGTSGFPQRYLAAVDGTGGVVAAAPVTECAAVVEGAEGETLIVMGVDPKREEAVRGYRLDQVQARNPLEFLLRPDGILLAAEFAARHDLRQGSKVTLTAGAGPLPLTVVGLLAPEGPARAFGGNLGVMYLPAAQKAFGRAGKLDRIDVVTEPAQAPAVAGRLARQLGGACRIEEPAMGRRRVESMVRSFQGGMTLTSLIGVFVGMFLIYNTMTISIVQRRGEIGILRALGVRRNEVMMAIGGESLLIGLIGSLLGCGLGVFLARSAVAVVAHTVTTVYVSVNMDQLTLTPDLFLQCMVAGVGAAGLSAFFPAREAARISPLEAIGRAGGEIQHPLEITLFQLGGLAGIAAAAAIIEWAPFAEPVTNGYVGLGLMLLSFSTLAPAATHVTAWLVRSTFLPLLGIEGRLAHANLLRGLRRSSVTVGALFVAIASLVTYAIYIHSFKLSVDAWIDQSIRADLFVCSGASLPGPSSLPIPEEVYQAMQARPEFRLVLPARITKIDYRGTRVALIGLSMSKFVKGGRVLLREGDRGELAAMGDAPGDQILISQNFARRHGVKLHEVLELDTPNGPVGFTVVGIHTDYTSDQGVIIIDRAVYLQHWQDPRIDVVDLFLKPGADLEVARTSLVQEFGAKHRLFIMSNHELRAEIEALIDKSFTVSYALEFVALVVAVLGILNTLLANVLDRTREIGVLRALGSLRGQVRRIVLVEAGLMAAAACLLGVIGGLVMGWFSVTTVNYQATGWETGYHVPALRVAVQVLIIFAAALLAGGYPSGRAARINIVEALECE